MLNNRKTFEKLMNVLHGINPDMPLPGPLEPYLWENMEPGPFCKQGRSLEHEGAVPKNAYYVVSGFVIVYGFNSKAERYVMRIYGENTIVAMDCFMRQQVSKYTIVGCKDTLVWSISNTHMQQIYKDLEGMKDVAWQTASKYSDHMEEMRSRLLSKPSEERVLKFYSYFKGLLPATKSPVRDVDIADYLQMSVDWLKKTRRLLKEKGLLPKQ
ncbi:Crp/Fnr family transcriptional regulator [Pedobacter frigoris]|uniref:Crp/Fnr family transcriptional regulator n=1 Tax=Pedobacter frigoris TaxID=2571272 RepID=A0A4U1CMD5_9SPHI|nr:cyclic nucleotide-binding domain-containing protein [Pedobacter frigoris]TKC07676.1 Crp/Fnr family transcriptional regulator [Pedobacter frigoris]